MQLNAAKVKLQALQEMGAQDLVCVQAATVTRLTEDLASSEAALAEATAAETAAAHEAAGEARRAMESDEKAERLRMTAESLSQGVAQMAAVRKLRGEAIELRAKSARLKETCEDKRTAAQKARERVCTCAFISSSTCMHHSAALIARQGECFRTRDCMHSDDAHRGAT